MKDNMYSGRRSNEIAARKKAEKVKEKNKQKTDGPIDGRTDKAGSTSRVHATEKSVCGRWWKRKPRSSWSKLHIAYTIYHNI